MLNRKLFPIRHLPLLTLLAATLMLSGCASVVIGGAATVGVAAFQERGVEGAARDLKLESGIMERWVRVDHEMVAKLSIEVYEGRALLTGITDSPKMAAEAVQLAWKVAGVKDVLNEIQVISSGSGIVDLARDSWITTQLKTKLTFDEDVMAINYAIETVNGTVYLIGIGQNQAEVDRATAYARSIGYVRKVISHVRVKGTK